MVVLEADGDICGWPRVFIPASCQGVEVVIGIDEAGRGPVLGSLLYCAAFWPVTEHEAICKLGFDDSKQLKEGERDRFFEKIRAHGSIGWVIAELSAERISQEMLRRSPVSLNALSYDAVVWMLEVIRDYKLGEPPVVTNVYVDTVGDPETYRMWLVRHMGEDFAKYTIEKKADATYKVPPNNAPPRPPLTFSFFLWANLNTPLPPHLPQVVSAASIIAKVTRDTSIKEWVWAEPSLRPAGPPLSQASAVTSTSSSSSSSSSSSGSMSRSGSGSSSGGAGLDLNFGSGYPGDENCVRWLATAQVCACV